MQAANVESGSNVGVTLADLAAKVTVGKGLAEDLVEIGKRKTQRAIRKGFEAGEDYLDDTTHYIKHHPWRSVGIAAGLGAVVGLLCSWICGRTCESLGTSK